MGRRSASCGLTASLMSCSCTTPNPRRGETAISLNEDILSSAAGGAEGGAALSHRFGAQKAWRERTYARVFDFRFRAGLRDWRRRILWPSGSWRTAQSAEPPL